MKLRRGAHTKPMYDRCDENPAWRYDTEDAAIRCHFEPKSGVEGFPLERRTVYAVDLSWNDIVKAIMIFAGQGNEQAKLITAWKSRKATMAQQLLQARQNALETVANLEATLTNINIAWPEVVKEEEEEEEAAAE